MAARRLLSSSAIWFLSTFGSGPSIDALSGDLAEEYQQGNRSIAWLWQQSVAGVVVSFASEVRAHPVVAGRAVLIGVSVLALLFAGVGPLLNGLNTVALHRLPLWFYAQWQVYSVLAAALSFVVATLAGWAVGSLHRRHRAMATLSVLAVALIIAALDAELYRLIGNAMTHRRYVPYLLAHVMNVAGLISGLALGGFAFRRKGRDAALPE